MKTTWSIIWLTLCFSASSLAQWEPVNSGLGVYRFHVNESVVVSPDIECANVYSGPLETDSIKACVPSGTTGMIARGGGGPRWTVSFSNGVAGSVYAKDIIHPLTGTLSLAANGTTLFAGTYHNAFRSTDYGNSWTQMNSHWIIPYTDYWSIYTFSFSGTKIFARGAYAPYLSTDNGENWTEIGQGNSNFHTRFLLASRTCLFASSVNGTGIRSKNNGVTWDTVTYPGSLALIDTNLFAQHLDGQIDLSTDNGTSWKTVFPGSSPDDSTDYFCSSGNYLFYMKKGAGTYNYVIRKLWTGSSLVLASDMNFPPEYVQSSSIGKLSASGENVFLEYGRTFLSTNSGTDWQVLDLPPGVTGLAPFAVLGTSLFVGGTGIWRNELSSALPIQLASFEIQHCGTMAIRLTWSTASEISNYGFEVQRSTDGKSYASISGSFVPGHGTTNLSHTYSYVDADPTGTASYRLKQIDLDGTVKYSNPVQVSTATFVDEQKPVVFGLEQNYPNPFNPSTTIQYGLAGRSQVTLTVFNTLGQVAEILQDGVQQAGYYQVIFDGSNLASGLYFYRLRANDVVQTRKLLLLH